MSDIKNVRIEEDLLGTKEVSNDLYYGVHTLRAVENFKISTQKISDVPEFVRGMVLTRRPPPWRTANWVPSVLKLLTRS